MIRLARERETLPVVDDQQGSPTTAEDLAGALVAVARKIRAGVDGPWGTFHYAGAGVATWHKLAQTAIDLARPHENFTVKQIVPITTAEYPTPAARPAYSVLDCAKIRAAYGIQTIPWQEALARTMGRIYGKTT